MREPPRSSARFDRSNLTRPGDTQNPRRISEGPGPADECCGQKLPRGLRLTSPEYRAVFDGRRRVAGRTMVLWFRCTDSDVVKVGTVASRRSFRLAVDRNRARRRLRETFRRNQGNLAQAFDMVLVARVGANRVAWHDIQTDFRHLCRRIGVWREE